MNKKFAIFDMDGTLVNSMPQWKGLAAEFLHQKGIHSIPPHLMKQIESITIRESANLFVKEYHLNQTAEQIAVEMNFLMEQHYATDIPQKGNAKQYLQQLSAEGVRMCVASATPLHLMELCLERLGLLPYFDFLLSCEQVGIGKTSPAIYHTAAKKFDASPPQIAVFEDALYAAQTAKSAGYYLVGVYEKATKEEWQQLAALADETVLTL